jgi:hypothetical protein
MLGQFGIQIAIYFAADETRLINFDECNSHFLFRTKPAFITGRLNKIHGGYKMISLGNLLKRTIGIGVFGAALIFAASITANAQYRDDDRYYGQQNNGYYNQKRRTDKRHQKAEKREVKHHQKHEREEYGNSRELRRHQQQERRQVKRHQRNERDNGYNNNRRRNNNDDYYDDHDH